MTATLYGRLLGLTNYYGMALAESQAQTVDAMATIVLLFGYYLFSPFFIDTAISGAE